jgi:NitT/TauT family transport system permease protein
MRLAVGNWFTTVVAAEMIAADSGLGYLIFNSRLWMATDKIFIGIVCLGTLGLITDRFFHHLVASSRSPLSSRQGPHKLVFAA